MKTEHTTECDKLLNQRAVCETVSASRATIYRWIKKGVFPKPIKIGEQTIRWRESDIANWMNQKKAA